MANLIRDGFLVESTCLNHMAALMNSRLHYLSLPRTAIHELFILPPDHPFHFTPNYQAGVKIYLVACRRYQEHLDALRVRPGVLEDTDEPISIGYVEFIQGLNHPSSGGYTDDASGRARQETSPRSPGRLRSAPTSAMYLSNPTVTQSESQDEGLIAAYGTIASGSHVHDVIAPHRIGGPTGLQPNDFDDDNSIISSNSPRPRYRHLYADHYDFLAATLESLFWDRGDADEDVTETYQEAARTIAGIIKHSFEDTVQYSPLADPLNADGFDHRSHFHSYLTIIALIDENRPLPFDTGRGTPLHIYLYNDLFDKANTDYINSIRKAIPDLPSSKVRDVSPRRLTFAEACTLCSDPSYPCSSGPTQEAPADARDRFLILVTRMAQLGHHRFNGYQASQRIAKLEEQLDKLPGPGTIYAEIDADPLKCVESLPISSNQAWLVGPHYCFLHLVHDTLNNRHLPQAIIKLLVRSTFSFIWTENWYRAHFTRREQPTWADDRIVACRLQDAMPYLEAIRTALGRTFPLMSESPLRELPHMLHLSIQHLLLIIRYVYQ